MATRIIYKYICDCCEKAFSSKEEQSDYLTKIQVPVKCDTTYSSFPFDRYEIKTIEVCPDCLSEMKRHFLKEYNFESDYVDNIRRVRD